MFWVLTRYSPLSGQSTLSSTADLISLHWMCTVRNFLKILQIKLTRFLISAAGEIWANMLHNVYAALVNKYGFSSTARTNPDGREGNIVFLHLFIDGPPPKTSFSPLMVICVYSDLFFILVLLCTASEGTLVDPPTRTSYVSLHLQNLL